MSDEITHSLTPATTPRKSKQPNQKFPTGWKWRDRKGVLHLPREMETRHVFNTIMMIWNHCCRPNQRFRYAPTGKLTLYRLGPTYSYGYLQIAFRTLGAELQGRKNLLPHQAITLSQLYQHTGTYLAHASLPHPSHFYELQSELNTQRYTNLLSESYDWSCWTTDDPFDDLDPLDSHLLQNQSYPASRPVPRSSLQPIPIRYGTFTTQPTKPAKKPKITSPRATISPRPKDEIGH